MNLAYARVRSSEFGHVQDPPSERMRLRGDTESRSERCLQDRLRRSREDSAGGASQERAGRGVRLSRAEADWYVDRDHGHVSDLAEVRFNGRQELVCDEPPIVEHDSDPPALGAVDTGDLHRLIVLPGATPLATWTRKRTKGRCSAPLALWVEKAEGTARIRRSRTGAAPPAG